MYRIDTKALTMPERMVIYDNSCTGYGPGLQA